VKAVRTYLAAALEYALDARLIENNPARKIELPSKLLRQPRTLLTSAQVSTLHLVLVMITSICENGRTEKTGLSDGGSRRGGGAYG